MCKVELHNHTYRFNTLTTGYSHTLGYPINTGFPTLLTVTRRYDNLTVGYYQTTRNPMNTRFLTLLIAVKLIYNNLLYQDDTLLLAITITRVVSD